MAQDNELSNIIRDLEKVENTPYTSSDEEKSDVHGRIIQLPRTDRRQLYKRKEYVPLEEVLDWQQTCPQDKRITDVGTNSEEEIRIALEINKRVAIWRAKAWIIECDAILQCYSCTLDTIGSGTESGSITIYRACRLPANYIYDTNKLLNDGGAVIEFLTHATQSGYRSLVIDLDILLLPESYERRETILISILSQVRKWLERNYNLLPLLQPTDNQDGAGSGCVNIEFPLTPDISNMDIVHDYEQIFKCVQITQEQAVQLEKNTRDQASSEKWHEERSRRITASNFGRIMLRKATVTQKFIDSLQQKKNFKSAATCYGTASEKVAITIYRKKTGNHVYNCGMVVNPTFPCIAASPDGKVCDSGVCGLLEVKCPYSIRDMTISSALEPENIRKDFHLHREGDNVLLKKTHLYWFQVQGQLLVTGAPFCDFVTYTRQDLIIQRILPSRECMEDILSKMCSLYGKFMYDK